MLDSYSLLSFWLVALLTLKIDQRVFECFSQSTMGTNHNLLYIVYFHKSLWVQTVESEIVAFSRHLSVERDVVRHFCSEIKTIIHYTWSSFMIKLNHNVTERLAGQVTGKLVFWKTPLMCEVSSMLLILLHVYQPCPAHCLAIVNLVLLSCYEVMSCWE